jgi:glycosyltransferase involved in cell wall biosynthesis
MKILQVRSIFPPQPTKWHGGATQVAYHISKELVRHGHRVEVWAANTLDMKTKIDSRLTVVDGIKVSYFPYIMPYSTFFLSPALVKAARSRLEEFDVIHIHNFRTFEGPAVAYYAKKKSVPYIMQAHGSLPVTDNKRNLKQCFDNLWGNKLLRNAAKVIAVTKMEAAQYRLMGVSEDRIEIVSNGIDLSEFENLPGRGEFRKKWGIGRDEKVVLYLGRLHKTKGIDLLIKAFSSVCREMKDTWLVVAGPDQGILAELNSLTAALGIKSKTLFTGPLYGRDKLASFVDANVFVTPSFLGFPITFLEALACGIPIITTTNGDRLDWIDRQTGYVVDYDEIQLSEAILRTINNSDRSKRFEVKAKKLVNERFAWPKVAEKVELIYRIAQGGE